MITSVILSWNTFIKGSQIVKGHQQRHHQVTTAADKPVTVWVEKKQHSLSGDQKGLLQKHFVSNNMHKGDHVLHTAKWSTPLFSGP